MNQQKMEQRGWFRGVYSRFGSEPILIRIARIYLLLALFSAIANAHHPHDPIDVVSLNPDYPNDPTILVSSPFPDVTVRSLDDAKTWSDAHSGIHGRSLKGIAYAEDWEESRRLYGVSQVGLYLSTNAGHQWQRLQPGNLNQVARVPPSGSRGEVLFVASDTQLYRSDDSGKTYEEVKTPTAQSDLRSLTHVSGDRGPILAFARGQQVFMSQDLGLSWLAADVGALVQAIEFSPDFANDGRVWLATHGKGVLVSSDGGRSYTKSGTGLRDPDVNDVVVNQAWPGTPDMYAATRDDGVYKSKDGGQTWHLTNLTIEKTTQTKNHFTSVVLSPRYPNDPSVFVGAFEGLYISRDKGESWTSRDIKPTRMGRVFAISPNFASDGTIYFVGYGMAPLVSTDRGETWERRSTGIGAGSVYSVALSPNFETDRLVMIGVWKGMRRSEDGGRTWTEILLPTPSGHPVSKPPVTRNISFSPNFENDRTVFAVNVAVWAKSTDGGVTWVSNPAESTWSKFITPSPNFAKDQILLTGGVTVHRSTDGGQSWMETDYNGNYKGKGWSVAQQVRYAPDFALSGEVYLINDRGFQRSIDGGQTWTPSDAGLDGHQPTSLQLSPEFLTDSTLFLSTGGGGLFRSTNRGQSWERLLKQGSPVDSIKTMAISPNFPLDQTLFAATYEGAWRSTDAGQTWALVSNVSVYDSWRKPWARKGEWKLDSDPLMEGYGGLWSDQPGDTLSLYFVGTGIRLFGTKGPKHGKATILLNGEKIGAIDCQSTNLMHQEVFFENMNLPLSNYELAVRIDDVPSDRSRVSVDFADVYTDGTLETLGDNILPPLPKPPSGSRHSGFSALSITMLLAITMLLSLWIYIRKYRVQRKRPGPEKGI